MFTMMMNGTASAITDFRRRAMRAPFVGECLKCML